MHQFELKGVAATQEMQRAARKVAVENGRLRDLLGQLGVSRAEIETYLQNCDMKEKDACGVRTVDRVGTVEVVGESLVCNVAQHSSPAEHGQIHLQQLPTLDPRLGQHQDKDSSIHPPKPTDTTDLYATLHVDSYMNTHPNTPMPLESCKSTPTIDILEEADCPNTADCFCPPTLPAPKQPLSSALEISCETAATIIAQMRGDGDQDAARASLGCSRGEKCNVKSSTIMQIMDER